MGATRQTHRECCNYCMWYGPVNQDGTMRKHRPATSEDRYGRKVQNRHEDHCQGSHKPFATFGCETTPTADQETQTVTETAPRYVVNQLGNSYFAVRNTVTELDVAMKTSRSGAQHIAACLADGTMVLDYLGKAVAAQKPVVETSSDTNEYGVFEDGECIETGFHGGYGRVAAGAAAKVHEDDPANDGLSYEVKALCPEHEEQAKDTCEECATEGCGAVAADDLDACGHCSDCTGS